MALRSRLPEVRAVVVAFGGLAVWLWLFTRLHNALGKDPASAFAHARTLRAVERTLHVDVEPAANRWLTGHPDFIQPAVIYYRSYYVVVLGVLVWTYLRHSEVFRRIRRALVAMTILVLPVFWALPMAPPRLVLPGVVDIVAEYDPLWGPATRDPNDDHNHFSAMPSLHVAWSLWCAYAVWSALRVRRPRWALLAWLFPVLMIVVVVTTANHYVLDVVGSFVLVTCSVGVSRLWGRVVDR
ncbi:phosphatase PAP2 family protein [Hamadaea sp. NPDC050747]|uniref:phosphatase PAP2 family protein n=1 Tax=Hamadaea sp. NPDC050747 TaxID=3155789 RepID=UPI0033E4B467